MYLYVVFPAGTIAPISEFSEFSRVYLPLPNPYAGLPTSGPTPMVTPIILGDIEIKPGEYK